MKIIVPMAGMGKRMRPHTLTTPKPLLPIAGKPIVQRLVEDITAVCEERIEEIAFIIGRFGEETEKNLINIAKNLGAEGKIFYQDEALGTAHAILCAKECLQGKVIVAFADTLFRADFKLNENEQGIIWVQQIADPSAFGVVKLDNEGKITDFIEKPKDFVSDLAIIGIYYFQDGNNLKNELQYLLDNNIKEKGEFQLTNALENMKNKGIRFTAGNVSEWLDCGNKDVTVYTNQRVLEFVKNKEKLLSNTAKLKNSNVIEPCFISDNVEIINSTIGPHVSIGKGTIIENSKITNSIISDNAIIKNATLTNSMLGNFVEYTGFNGTEKQVSIGDYSTIK
jgi:glucose-1-phosphate thymidylyltransferase